MVLQKSVRPSSLVGRRGRVYLRELGETAVWLLLIAIAAGSDRPGDRRTRAAPALLLALTFLDLWTLGQHRLLDTAPIRPLKDQSPVLARLAQERRRARVASNLGNLPILVGAGTISAYRTLNLPAVNALNTEAMGDPRTESIVAEALRATGTRLRIFPPVEIRVRQLLKRAELPGEPIDDPALARWMYGEAWASEQGEWVNRFQVWRPDDPPSKAWFLPLTNGDEETILYEWTGDIGRLLDLLARAEPLPAESSRPEYWTIPVPVNRRGWVIVSQLDDPQWSARWIGLEGQGDLPGNVQPAFRRPGDAAGGWQVVEAPMIGGRWRLDLFYEPYDLVAGAAITVVAWTAWIFCALAVALRRRPRPTPPNTPQQQPDGA